MAIDKREKLVGHQVRLFSSAHIKREPEAELRAASALLSVIQAVSEFGKCVVRRAVGPAGRISCYTEVEFPLLQDEAAPPENIRPDGIIEASWGKKQWSALLEVKVHNCPLLQDQVNKYHRLAKQEGFDALITVSNQAAQADDRPQVKIDGRLHIPVVHFSWARLLSEAQVLSRKKAVSDPDQKWILDEWIRYVDDDKSRILAPHHLGSNWVKVLKAFQTGSPAANSPELQDVVRHWLGYLQKAALRLRAQLGVEVRVRTKGKKGKLEKLVQRLAIKTSKEKKLRGILKVQDAAGDISIDVFLASRRVRYGLLVRAPTEGRQLTRINWLAKQLRTLQDMPNDLHVTAEWKGGKSTEGLAHEIANDPKRLLKDKQRVHVSRDVMPKRFFLYWTKPLKRNRGQSSAPVLENITKELEEFYRRVVEGIVKFVPQVPRISNSKNEIEEPDPEPNSKASGVKSHAHPLSADSTPEIATTKVPQSEQPTEDLTNANEIVGMKEARGMEPISED